MNDSLTDSPAPSENRPAPRASLDALRGLAALAVVLHHLQGVGILGISGTASLLLSRGLEVFFALSGFLILRTVLQPLTFSAGVYTWHRMRRILPVYLGSLGAVLLISNATPLLTRDGLADVAAHLVFVHAFFADCVTTLNPPAWSLSHEWIFYGLLLVLAVPLRRGKAGVIAVTGAMFLIALACRFAVRQDALSFGAPMFHPLCRLDAFVFGMLGAWGSLRQVDGRTARVSAGAVALAGLVLTAACLAWYGSFVSRVPVDGLAAEAAGQKMIDAWNRTKSGMLWYPAAFSLAAGVLVTGLAGLSTTGAVERISRRKPFLWLGKVSYSTYLWHMPVIGTLLAARGRVARTEPESTTWLDHPVAGPAITLGLIYLVSAASWQLLEQPFLKKAVPGWLRKRA